MNDCVPPKVTSFSWIICYVGFIANRNKHADHPPCLQSSTSQELFARLWGVGYILYVVSKYFDAAAQSDSVYNYAMANLWLGNRFRYHEDDDADYVRHQAHMRAGLSACAYPQQ